MMDLPLETKEPFHHDPIIGNRSNNDIQKVLSHHSHQFQAAAREESTEKDNTEEDMNADFKEEMIRLQLRLLQEKLNKEKARIEAMKASHFSENGSLGEYNERLKKALKKQQSIQAQLEEEYYRAKLQRITTLNQLQKSSQQISSRKSVLAPSSKPPTSSSTKFDHLMEMMVLNQTNAQNMIMNHLLLKSNESGTSMPALQNPSMSSLVMGEEKRTQNAASRDQAVKPVTSYGATMKSTPKASIKKNYPYPGNESQRRLRQLGYAALFCSLLDTSAQLQKFKPDSAFMFQVKVGEVISALHRLYLSEGGSISLILRDNCCNEEIAPFRILLEKTNQMNLQIVKQTAQDLMYIVENLAYQISDIMPVSGILGTQKKAGVYEMITNGQRYPDSYFMNIDLENIQLDSLQRTTNIGDSEAFHILLNVYLIQSLVKTLLAKPRQYRLAADHSLKVEENLRIIGTVFVFVYRRIVSQLIANKKGIRKGQRLELLPEPRELSGFLYSDKEMEPIYKKIKKSIDYSESIFNQWGEHYVSRLRNASF